MKIELTPMQRIKGAASSIRIICHGCGLRATWNDAIKLKWKYIALGRPSNEFYCPICQTKIE